MSPCLVIAISISFCFKHLAVASHFSHHVGLRFATNRRVCTILTFSLDFAAFNTIWHYFALFRSIATIYSYHNEYSFCSILILPTLSTIFAVYRYHNEFMLRYWQRWILTCMFRHWQLWNLPCMCWYWRHGSWCVCFGVGSRRSWAVVICSLCVHSVSATSAAFRISATSCVVIVFSLFRLCLCVLCVVVIVVAVVVVVVVVIVVVVVVVVIVISSSAGGGGCSSVVVVVVVVVMVMVVVAAAASTSFSFPCLPVSIP